MLSGRLCIDNLEPHRLLLGMRRPLCPCVCIRTPLCVLVDVAHTWNRRRAHVCCEPPARIIMTPSHIHTGWLGSQLLRSWPILLTGLIDAMITYAHRMAALLRADRLPLVIEPLHGDKPVNSNTLSRRASAATLQRTARRLNLSDSSHIYH